MQRLEKILAQKAAPKVNEWQRYGNCCKVTPNPHFLKKCKGGTKKKFSKSSPRLRGPKAHWRKWYYPLSSTHLKCKNWRRFWSKKAAPKVREWPSYGNIGKVTKNPHFLEKCKGGTKGNFFKKIAQKDALAKKADKPSGANGIIL